MPNPFLHLDKNPEFIADLHNEGLLNRDIREKWGCSNGYVGDRRAKVRKGIPLTDSIKPATAELADYEGLVSERKVDEDGNIALTKISERIIPLSEWLDDLRADGFNPDEFETSHSHSVWMQHTADQRTKHLYSNKFSARRLMKKVPAWPVIQPARDPIVIKPLKPTPRASRFKTAVVGADTQIGFDMDDAGNLTPYHDDAAMDIFLQVVAIENPEQTLLAGDILDLSEQGRWAQEARFANTTQHALERGRVFAAETRARTNGVIKWIEGNHDKRMQSFMEANAKASMGLKKAGYPDSYPVMSLPNLIGLDEFDTDYVDAYPAAQHWIADNLRVIHGTKANSSGSTASQYSNQMPHISTVFGHTHRLEVQSKTTFDRAGKIRTMSINPGCLCRVDGAVPSVHGARHLDGSKATYWEDWQQGVAVVRYLDDGTFFVELVQIDDGRGMHLGQELHAAT